MRYNTRRNNRSSRKKYYKRKNTRSRKRYKGGSRRRSSKRSLKKTLRNSVSKTSRSLRGGADFAHLQQTNQELRGYTNNITTINDYNNLYIEGISKSDDPINDTVGWKFEKDNTSREVTLDDIKEFLKFKLRDTVTPDISNESDGTNITSFSVLRDITSETIIPTQKDYKFFSNFEQGTEVKIIYNFTDNDSKLNKITVIIGNEYGFRETNEYLDKKLNSESLESTYTDNGETFGFGNGNEN